MSFFHGAGQVVVIHFVQKLESLSYILCKKSTTAATIQSLHKYLICFERARTEDMFCAKNGNIDTILKMCLCE